MKKSLINSINSLFIITMLLSSLCMMSCKQDTYETGDGDLSLVTAEFGEIITGRDTLVNEARTDAESRLIFSEPLRLKWMNVPDSAYRSLIYYYVNPQDNTAPVKPYSIVDVPVTRPLRPERFKNGVVCDPVQMESAWVSKNRRWLNFSVFYRTGEVAADSIRQILGVVRDTMLTDSRTLCLRLYHKQNGVPEYYSQRAYLSMPMSSLEQADTLRLTVTTYSGDMTYRLPLK